MLVVSRETVPRGWVIRSQTTNRFMKERFALYRILLSICLMVSHPSTMLELGISGRQHLAPSMPLLLDLRPGWRREAGREMVYVEDI